MSIVPVLFGVSSPIMLSANPPNCYGSRTGAGVCISDPTTVTATGGVGTKTYSWAEVTATPATVDSPSSATTTFRATLGVNDEVSAIFRCTVTDSVGTEATIDVTVFLWEISFF